VLATEQEHTLQQQQQQQQQQLVCVCTRCGALCGHSDETGTDAPYHMLLWDVTAARWL
jgi:hypothetical protein